MRALYGLTSHKKIFLYIPGVIALHSPHRNFFYGKEECDFRCRICSKLTRDLEHILPSEEVLKDRGWVIREKEVPDRLLNPLVSSSRGRCLYITQSFVASLLNLFFQEFEEITGTYSNTDETGIGYYPEEEFQGDYEENEN